jgi:hypothetical protein
MGSARAPPRLGSSLSRSFDGPASRDRVPVRQRVRPQHRGRRGGGARGGVARGAAIGLFLNTEARYLAASTALLEETDTGAPADTPSAGRSQASAKRCCCRRTRMQARTEAASQVLLSRGTVGMHE